MATQCRGTKTKRINRHKSEKGLRYMQAYMVQANKQLQERK